MTHQWLFVGRSTLYMFCLSFNSWQCRFPTQNTNEFGSCSVQPLVYVYWVPQLLAGHISKILVKQMDVVCCPSFPNGWLAKSERWLPTSYLDPTVLHVTCDDIVCQTALKHKDVRHHMERCKSSLSWQTWFMILLWRGMCHARFVQYLKLSSIPSIPSMPRMLRWAGCFGVRLSAASQKCRYTRNASTCCFKCSPRTAGNQ